MAIRRNYKTQMHEFVKDFGNPKMRCIADEITGQTFALCLMESEDKHERRIVRRISKYYPPKELIAFMEGYYQALCDNCFE